MNQLRTWQFPLLMAVAGAMLLSSCKKTTDDVTPASTSNPSADLAANNWILDNMRTYYYWNDQIPAQPDTTLAPLDFFYTLLYDYKNTTNPQRDRFSWIESSAADLSSSLGGQTKTSGLEYQLSLRASGSTDVIGVVIYTQKGSPADLAGIKRGDIFYSVNGQNLTTTNYQAVLNANSTTHTYGFATVTNGQLVNSTTTKTVTDVVFQENPVYLDSVYTIQGKKIGYLVYNQFIPGPNGTNTATYDQQLDAIFGKFKQQGVNELVLDLRYNPGGYTSSSTNLASLIGKGVTTNDLYFRQEWNKTITPDLQAYDKQYKTDSFNDYFVQKANNIGGNLSRLYVLTTDNTASASELIINGLRPFMTVNTIGSTTYGKNVGSITISDDTGKIPYGLQPIVFRSYNKNNESNYYSGFTPTVAVDETLPFVPFGDTSDPLLNEAIFQITGTRTAHRGASAGQALTVLGSSIQRKAGNRNMFTTLKPLQLKALR